MNQSTLGHTATAILFQVVLWIVTGDWWIGAAFGSAFFLGREHAQAEYRWIEKFGNHRRENLEIFSPFDPRVWTKLDAWLDWIAPVVAVVIFAVVMGSVT